MAIKTFYCESCKTTVKEICYGQTSVLECKTCSKPMVRKQKLPSMIVKEVIDNGVQPRRSVQTADSRRLLDERNEEHEKYLKGEK